MNLERFILEGTQYGGDKEAGRMALSASQLDDDILRIYLRHRYGVMPSEKITMATIGTLVHKGLECLLEENRKIGSEVELEADMPNGWKLTGTADIVDHWNHVIYDVKVIKKYRVTKLKEQGADDPYAWQLNAYRYMIEKESGIDYDIKVAALSPDAGFDFKRAEEIPVLQIVDVPRIANEILEEKFSRQVFELMNHIESGTTPERCTDTWPRRVGGKTIPVRCTIYCDFKNVCPRYQPKDETVVASWGF